MCPLLNGIKYELNFYLNFIGLIFLRFNSQSFLLPLHIVVRKNLLTIAKVLLEHSPEGVDRPSKFGETPLHFACMRGHLEMAELLVKLVKWWTIR